MPPQINASIGLISTLFVMQEALTGFSQQLFFGSARNSITDRILSWLKNHIVC